MEDRLLDSDFLKKLNGFKLNTNIILNKGYSGERKSKSKGDSVEFSDFREYTPGDDFRKIDWNAYGRFEKLFIKLFMEERESLINIFLDSSKSMDFGEFNKSFISKKIALALGYIGISGLDRVNLYTIEEENLQDMGYIKGKNSLNRLIGYLDNIKFNSIYDLFKSIEKKTYKRGISIIISDLFTENLEDTIKYLSYMNQSIIIIHVLSKEELKPKIMGDVRLIDSETLEDKDISITPKILDAYNKNLDLYLNNVKEISRKYGCFYSLISTEVSMDKILFDNLIRTGILR